MLASRFVSLILILIFVMACISQGADGILVVKFDCQAPLGYLTGPLSDSLAANLKVLQVPVASRVRWETLLERSGYRENDLDYNPPVLSRLAGELGVKGAVYGQVYTKNGLLIMMPIILNPAK